MLSNDCIKLILDVVYESDIFRYSSISQHYRKVLKDAEKLGAKLIYRSYKDFDSDEMHAWHGAMKHAVKTQNYILLEVLVARYSKNINKFCYNLMCRCNVCRYIVLWNDVRALEIMHKYKLLDIKLALLSYGTLTQIKQWLVMNISDFPVHVIVRHIFELLKPAVIDYVLFTSVIGSYIRADSAWFIWLATNNGIDTPFLLSRIYDIFECHSIQLTMQANKKRRLLSEVNEVKKKVIERCL